MPSHAQFVCYKGLHNKYNPVLWQLDIHKHNMWHEYPQTQPFLYHHTKCFMAKDMATLDYIQAV